jgi:phosphoglycerate dehydrogenase-like enzyme
MAHLVVEEDKFLRVVPAMLDPAATEEHRHAIADFFAHDEPDFAGWCHRLHQKLPGLYPATVEFARDQADLRRKIAAADGVIVESLRVGAEELGAASRLAIVQKFGGIAANIDLDACARHGVAVATLRRRVNVAVAEQAFAMMIALAKRVCELNGVVGEQALRAAGYDPKPYDRRYTGNSNYGRISGIRTLAGSSLGLIGLGEIGRELARRARAFEMDVLYHQRTRLSPADEAALGARFVPLMELMATSDYMSIQVPLNDTTRGMVGRPQLEGVKPGAILVNAARADLIDRGALMDALGSGRLGGYGIDVGYEEPAKPGEPLLGRRNVIYMPHTGVAARQNALSDMEEMFLKMRDAISARRR